MQIFIVNYLEVVVRRLEGLRDKLLRKVEATQIA